MQLSSAVLAPCGTQPSFGPSWEEPAESGTSDPGLAALDTIRSLQGPPQNTKVHLLLHNWVFFHDTLYSGLWSEAFVAWLWPGQHPHLPGWAWSTGPAQAARPAGKQQLWVGPVGPVWPRPRLRQAPSLWEWRLPRNPELHPYPQPNLFISLSRPKGIFLPPPTSMNRGKWHSIPC